MSKLDTHIRPEAAPREPRAPRELVDRVAASRHFRRAQRLRDFLSYVCEQSFAGTSNEVNEQSVGHRVFARGVDYDPSSDNIVRVEARELRKRLASYFADEGRDEPIVIRIPKGGYVPVFEPRVAVDSPQAEAVGDDATNPAADHWGTRTLIAILVVAISALGGLNLYLVRQNSRLENAADSRSAGPARVNAFWGEFFKPETPTLIALADSNFTLLQDLRKESVPFGEYSSGRYFAGFEPPPGDGGNADRMLSMIASRRYTSLADVDTVARLVALNDQRSPLVIRFARDLSPRDLRGRNAVLLGSVRSMPWVSLFEEQCRFRFGYDPAKERPFVEDTAPPTGAATIYMGGPTGEDPYAAYGVVASLDSLDGDGGVLLVAGTNMQGTEAAGEFLLNPERLEAFLTRIRWEAGGELPSFEVVLKLVTVGGSSVSSEIVASRF